MTIKGSEEKIKELIEKHSDTDWAWNGEDEVPTDIFDKEKSLQEAMTFAYEQGVRDSLEKVKFWKNEGEDLTETDLVLENVLLAISSLLTKE